jgi:hypothetical protein
MIPSAPLVRPLVEAVAYTGSELGRRRVQRDSRCRELDGRAAILWSLRDHEETIVAGFVIGLPTGGRSQFLSICDVPLSMGAAGRRHPGRSFTLSTRGLRYFSRRFPSGPRLRPPARSHLFVSRAGGCVGGEDALQHRTHRALAWLIGVLAVDSAGDLVPVLLLAGLALLLLAFLLARETAIRRATSDPNQTP